MSDHADTIISEPEDQVAAAAARHLIESWMTIGLELEDTTRPYAILRRDLTALFHSVSDARETRERIEQLQAREQDLLAELGVAPLVFCSNGETGDGQMVCTGCGAVTDDPHPWRMCAERWQAEADSYVHELVALRRVDQQLEDRHSRSIAKATASLAIKMTRMEVSARAANSRVEKLEARIKDLQGLAVSQSMLAEAFADRIDAANMILSAACEHWNGRFPPAVLDVLGRVANNLHTEPALEPPYDTPDDPPTVPATGDDEVDEEAAAAHFRAELESILTAAVTELPTVPAWVIDPPDPPPEDPDEPDDDEIYPLEASGV